MGIYFKFSPQKSDYSRTYYYFDLDKKTITINYQTGETVIVKKDGTYFEDFRIHEEENISLSFEDILSIDREDNINSIRNFIEFVSIDENATLRIKLLKQYGKSKESDVTYLYPDWYYLNENKWDYEITDLKTNLSIFEITIKKWKYLLSDIITQIYNLTVLLKDEINRLNQNQNIGSPIVIRTIKSAIISLQFNYLETLGNFIANLIIDINNDTDGSPSQVSKLSTKELSQVKEDRRFTRIEDKIALFPVYLAKILGITYELNKGGLGWNSFKVIKKKRDIINHPKIMDEDIYINLSIDKIRPNVEIKDSDLFTGIEVIYWYNNEIEYLFQLVGINEKDFNDNLIFCMLFIQLSEYSVLTDKELDKKYKFANSEIFMNMITQHFKK